MIPALVRAGVFTTFDLDNVMFSDGGTATGSFTFDSASGSLSNVSITTSPDGNVGTAYTSGTSALGPNLTRPTFELFSFVNGNRILQLEVNLPVSLTSPNAIVGPFNGEFLCSGQVCASARDVSGGALVPTSLPAALPLFAGGLGALGVLGGAQEAEGCCRRLTCRANTQRRPRTRLYRLATNCIKTNVDWASDSAHRRFGQHCALRGQPRQSRTSER